MENIVEKYFSVNLRLMKIFGYYSPKKHTRWYRLYTLLVYFTLIALVPVLAAMDIFVNEISLKKISDSAFVICECSSFIMKFLPFVFKPDQVRKVIYMVESPQFAVHTETQKKIVDEGIATCKKISKLFLNCCIVTLTTWALVPLLMPEDNLPLEIWLPFDYKADKKLYIVSFIYVVVAVGNGALTSGVVDPLIAGLISHAASQILVLKVNLQNLEQDAEKEIQKLRTNSAEANSKKNILIQDKINLCIEHHNSIIEYLDLLEDTFSLSVFFQFSASVLVICVSCLRLGMVKLFTFDFFVMVMFIFTTLCEIFLFCYFGTLLVEENNSLITSIYMGQWYKYDKQSKKLLITLMERSKRPMIITAGKVLDLSLETFTTILRRAYSLLAVLKNY